MNRSLAIRAFFVIAAGLLATACSAPASGPSMAVTTAKTSFATSPKLKHAVFINNVSGGSETNPLWISMVDDKSFKSALEWSLINLEYNASSPEQAKYTVDAQLISLEQPFIGISFDVKSTVNYNVTKNGTTTTYPITAIGTAQFSDGVLANQRLQVANERSMQENIKAFLTELAKAP